MKKCIARHDKVQGLSLGGNTKQMRRKRTSGNYDWTLTCPRKVQNVINQVINIKLAINAT